MAKNGSQSPVAPTFRSPDAGLKASATPKLGHYAAERRLRGVPAFGYTSSAVLLRPRRAEDEAKRRLPLLYTARG